MRATFLFLATLALYALLVQAVPIERRGVVNGITGSLKKLTGLFKGQGTFFHPATEGGAAGACGGYKESDQSKIVALSTDRYGNQDKTSDWCFQQVKITHGDKSILATITDACPTCTSNSLDLTPHLFQQLADPKVGVIDIDWCVVGTSGCTHEKEATGGGADDSQAGDEHKGKGKKGHGN
ncbi:hypothetical protein DM01DRAFT_1407546, partial [Hesseltinella vesiculosa]